MPLKSLDPDLRIIDRALVLNEEGIVEAAIGFGFDLADLSVEPLFPVYCIRQLKHR